MCASATTMNKRKQEDHDDDCDVDDNDRDDDDCGHGRLIMLACLVLLWMTYSPNRRTNVSRKTENKQNINLESSSTCVRDVPWYSWGVCVHGNNEARIILHYVQ